LTSVLGYLNERWDECATPPACGPAPYVTPITNEVDAAKRATNEQLLQEEIRVYPNPTSDQVFILMKDLEGKEGLVEVFNSYGQKVAERKYLGFPNGSIQFDVKDFSNGMHYISITVDGNKRFTKKFVVSK